MKKLIVALLLAITIVGFAKQTHALSLDDLLQEIKGLKQQVVELKEQLGAAVLKATTASPATMSTAATSVTAIKQTKDLNAPGLIRRWQDGGCQVYDGNAWIGTISLNQGDCVKVFPASSVTTNNIQITTNPSSAGVVVNQAPATTAPAVNVPVTQPTKASFTHNLKVGEKSEEVTMLQKLLAAAGYLSADNATGLYGKMTVAAVKAFQKDKGINDDGTVVGPKTQAAFGFNGTITATPFPGGSSLPCSVTSTTPQIKVISPNGGESYQPGQQITVKWATCGIPATSQMNILLEVPSMSWDIGLIQNYTSNDGNEVVTLPTTTQVPNLPSGTLFKIKVIQVAPVGTLDESDNLFTIGGAQQACSIYPPVQVTASTTASQYVAAGNNGITNGTVDTFKITAPQPTTITELKFSAGPGVTTVTVGNISAPVVSNIAWLQGLNIAVPQGGAGVTINAYLSYAGVGSTGIASNTMASSSLIYEKFSCANGITSTSTAAVDFQKMWIVASKPTLTLVDSNDALINGTVKLASLTVTADPHGAIGLNWFKIFVSSLNNVSIPNGTNNIIVKDNGVVVPTSNDVLSVLPSGGDETTIMFPSTYVIPAGATKTFDLYVAASNVIGGPNTNRLDTRMGASNFFVWTDIAGNGAYGALDGTHIYNYPANISSIND